jgi:hypothetical protein
MSLRRQLALDASARYRDRPGRASRNEGGASAADESACACLAAPAATPGKCCWWHGGALKLDPQEVLKCPASKDSVAEFKPFTRRRRGQRNDIVPVPLGALGSAAAFPNTDYKTDILPPVHREAVFFRAAATHTCLGQCPLWLFGVATLSGCALFLRRNVRLLDFPLDAAGRFGLHARCPFPAPASNTKKSAACGMSGGWNPTDARMRRVQRAKPWGTRPTRIINVVSEAEKKVRPIGRRGFSAGQSAN